MKIVRWVLGRIVLLVEFVMMPKGVQRDEATQQKLDEEMSQYSMYQYAACPFCVKVRRAMKKQSLTVKLVNAKEPQHGADLVAFGGEMKVPCLRISKENGDDTWLYESDDIIRFLNQRAEAVSAVAVAV